MLLKMHERVLNKKNVRDRNYIIGILPSTRRLHWSHIAGIADIVNVNTMITPAKAPRR